MARLKNQCAKTLDSMVSRLTALIEQGKDVKSACKEVLLNTPNISRHRSNFFKIIDETFPELKSGLNPVFFNNFKHGNKFFFEYLTDTCNHCKICGIPIPSDHEFCSVKCMWATDEIREKQRHGVLKRFGEKGLACDEIMNKRKKTCLEKYGFEYASQNPDVIRKALETNRRNHGGMLAAQTEMLKEQIRQTNIKRYGVESAAQNAEIKEKIKQTNLERTGYVCNFADPEKRAEYDRICREKYGDDYTKKRAEKQRQTFFAKYGVENYQQINRPHVEMFNKKDVMENFIDDNNEFMVNEFCGFFNLTRTMANRFKQNNNICNRNNDWHKGRSSKQETELYDMIACDNKYQNDRQILDHGELDIVLPDIKLAIEYDGIHWHSEQLLSERTDNPKNFHLNKTLECAAKGYQLFHVFESEDLSIWKSIIDNKLGLNKRIYARKCEIREVGFNESLEFLNANHLQGSCVSSIRFGLYYNNELIQLITFGKSRFDKTYDYELLRLCTLKGYCVIGGASKLFKHALQFVKGKIISYANRRFSKGDIYEKLGFTLQGETKPNYYYTKTRKLYSRIRFQKHKLQKLLPNFDPELSEYDNMLNNGYDRIYDCGNLIYTFANE